MPRANRRRSGPPALSVNVILTLIVITLFVYIALTGSFNRIFGAALGILFVAWILANIYTRDPGNFKPNLLSAIIGTVAVLVFYLVIVALFAGAVYLAYNAGLFGQDSLLYYLEIASLLPLFIAVFLYLILYRRAGPKISAALYGRKRKAGKIEGIARQLGFDLRRLSFMNVGLGLLVFAAIMGVEIAVSLLSVATNVQVNTNVNMLFAGAPLWFLVFASVIEPINEEIFFRGFLVPRLGVWPSAIVFGIVHYTYNSTFGIEVLAAFLFAVLSGYVYKRTGSLYPGIVAHILINSMAALSILAAGT